jgi:hypothetical protein
VPVRMSDEVEVESEKSARQPESRRKTYQKPDFRFERVFETMALACGKISASQPQCRFNRKTS